MRKKHSASEIVIASEEPVPYRLRFPMRKDGSGVASWAKLTSRSLDRTMHGRGGLRVAFESIDARKNAPSPVLDPFESASLLYYLQNQETVRRELQRQLNDLLCTWDPKKEIGRDEAVWEQTKVEAIRFAPRYLPRPAAVKHVRSKFAKREAERILRAEFDSPDTQTSFTIYMSPDWACSHQLIVPFRDDEAIELQVEG